MTKLKCCMSVVRLIFYWSIGTQNLMATFIFKFGQKEGQFQVKLGQIRPNVKIPKFLSKTCLSFPVSSRDSKNVIYVNVRHLKRPKTAFQKCDVISLICFLPFPSKKERYCFDILYACCFYVSRSHVYRFFWIT